MESLWAVSTCKAGMSVVSGDATGYGDVESEDRDGESVCVWLCWSGVVEEREVRGFISGRVE